VFIGKAEAGTRTLQNQLGLKGVRVVVFGFVGGHIYRVTTLLAGVGEAVTFEVVVWSPAILAELLAAYSLHDGHFGP
jgi:hypothetical protein